MDETLSGHENLISIAGRSHLLILAAHFNWRFWTLDIIQLLATWKWINPNCALRLNLKMECDSHGNFNIFWVNSSCRIVFTIIFLCFIKCTPCMLQARQASHYTALSFDRMTLSLYQSWYTKFRKVSVLCSFLGLNQSFIRVFCCCCCFSLYRSLYSLVWHVIKCSFCKCLNSPGQ